MKFTWNVEEQKLTMMGDYEYKHLVDKFTNEEIQEALKTYGGVDIDLFWKLYAKFQAEKDTIKKAKGYSYTEGHWLESWDFNTVSLKAWCKRNKDLFNSPYGWEYQKYYLIGYNNEIYITWDLDKVYKKFRESFSSLLSDLRKKEKEWFREHDEYCIIEDENLKLLQDYSFPEGLWLAHGSDGIHIYRNNSDDDFQNRKPTLEEMKQINDYYKKVREAVMSIPVPTITY